MGYSLECYALDHGTLRSLVGSGRREIVQQVLDAQGRLFGSNPGEGWRTALHELVVGARGRALAQSWAAHEHRAAPPPVEATDAEAMAMTALVRFLGHRAGELICNSRAGDKFRAMFQPDFEPPQFVMPELVPLLLKRPLAGLVRDDYPAWGGWTLPELTAAMGGHSEPADAPPDEDQETWLYELNDILVDVRSCDTDLVTLYL